ncbi:DUF4271 domain-containing protein [Lutimonas saemankumensis]|uniref:DUF4271 domain-containing protein n=1 Tax=Lutimonas saemankumensis TaxID=483016 RepID=UPI001CD3CC8B|nr:DUF4271 domain-containing protein [Lutimonas saemankumensis]MCA0932974.1 DUF4271 domain-containing protein [Lutimonas saemankumensis]
MFEGIERISVSSDWITLIFLAVLILVAVLQLNFTERFSKLFSLIYSEKYYTDFYKTRPLIFNWFHVIFFFIIIFNISLALFFALNTFKESVEISPFYLYSKIFVMTITYFGIRYVLGYFLAFIFELEESQNYFTFLKISNLALISILILPLLVLANYSAGVFHKFLITFGLIVSVAIALFRYFVLIKNEKLSFNNIFYLFLYLCALELAPFIVIYKLFVD